MLSCDPSCGWTMLSIQTSPVNHSAGPLTVGCFGWSPNASPSVEGRACGFIEKGKGRLPQRTREDSIMRAAIFNGPKDVQVGHRPDPVIQERTDARRGGHTVAVSILRPVVATVVNRLMAAGCVTADEEAEELIAAAPDDDTLELWIRRREQGEPPAWITG